MARLNPSDRVLASYNRGRIYMYQGRYEEALSELDEGAAIEPEHPMIKMFRARVFTIVERSMPRCGFCNQFSTTSADGWHATDSGDLSKRTGTTHQGK